MANPKKILELIKIRRPSTTHSNHIGAKIDELVELIGLYDTLFLVMQRNQEESTNTLNADINYSGQIIADDLLVIAQILNDNLREELKNVLQFIIEQEDLINGGENE